MIDIYIPQNNSGIIQLYKFRLPFHSISTAGEWRDPRVLVYLSSPIYVLYIACSNSHLYFYLSICIQNISTYSILCRSYCMSIFYLPAYLLVCLSNFCKPVWSAYALSVCSSICLAVYSSSVCLPICSVYLLIYLAVYL